MKQREYLEQVKAEHRALLHMKQGLFNTLMAEEIAFVGGKGKEKVDIAATTGEEK